jgi:hypothetical protein
MPAVPGSLAVGGHAAQNAYDDLDLDDAFTVHFTASSLVFAICPRPMFYIFVD